MKKVLITGASGLIGKRLTQMLLAKGYRVNVLGRAVGRPEPEDGSEPGFFSWNVERGKIDAKAFEDVSAIIHLAGAGVADMKWTAERKQEIMDSRVKSAQMIFDFLKKGRHTVNTFISASAMGYYGDCADEIITEERKRGKGFLAEVCEMWEAGAIKISELGIREVRCRIGIVLAKDGGALPELTKTLAIGLAPYFLKQNLFYPWVHIDDVCGIMIHALENENVHGAYNTTANQPLLMKDLMREIIAAKKAKAVLVPAPPIAIKLAMGEMSEMILGSQRCSAAKIMKAGYRFSYPKIGKALGNIYQ